MGASTSKVETPPPPTKDQGTRKPPQTDDDEAGEIKIPATVVKLPHNYDEILKDADDTAVDRTSTEKLYDQLYHGVFLNQHKKASNSVSQSSNNSLFVKLFSLETFLRCADVLVDKNLKNYFMLYAKGLSITWAEDNSYWHWPLIEESSDVPVAAVELLNVCWLEVHGTFNTSNFTPRTQYEVVFIAMLKDPAYGWQIPVNLRLILANGSRQEHKEDMMDKARGKWTEILAGEFETLPENEGEMEISLYEYEGGI